MSDGWVEKMAFGIYHTIMSIKDMFSKIIGLPGKELLLGAAAAGIIIFLSVLSSGQNAPQEPSLDMMPSNKEQGSQAQAVLYPDEYFLQPDEIPAGFQVGSLGAEAEMLGFTSNPGPLTNKSLYRLFYGNASKERIEAAHVAAYVKPEDVSKELGIFFVRYKSAEDFEAEMKKIVSSPSGPYPAGPLYLRDSLTLVILWSDAKAYLPAMEEVAQKFQERLHLTPLN